MNDVIYIVKGTTGEHGDLNVWNVGAFTDRDDAEEWKNLCQQRADAVVNKDPREFNCVCEELVDALTDKYVGEQLPLKEGWKYADVHASAEARAKREAAETYNQYDPDMQVDYTGTRYFMDTVPFNLKVKKETPT